MNGVAARRRHDLSGPPWFQSRRDHYLIVAERAVARGCRLATSGAPASVPRPAPWMLALADNRQGPERDQTEPSRRAEKT